MAGLLDYASSVAGEAKKNVQGLLADPRQALKDILNNLTSKAAAQQAANKAAWATRDPKVMAQNALDSSQTALGFAPLGITAWHGSPHKFDKFRTDKIGTGEGAQAYGHGLYLAESPDVARGYAQTLDPMAQAARSGLDAEGTAARVLQAVDYDKRKAVEELTSRKNMPHVKGDAAWAAKMDAAIAHIQGAEKTSNLYKTDIPEEAVARFLDWDKPLSQQAQHIQSFSIASGADLNKAYGGVGGDGSNLVKLLNQKIGSPDKVSELLKKAGVPGIRYLDGSSLSAGQGSSNFVAFDPEMIRILERNGQATGAAPWQPGEWRGLLGNN